MMSMSEALSAAQTEQYFTEHYSQDDYYTQGQTCIGQWIGQGAAELGLAGEVSREDFSALLQGIDPHSQKVIVPPRATTESIGQDGTAFLAHQNQSASKP